MINTRLLLAALLATALVLPHAPALAEVNPPAAMVPNAANATLPTARNNIGAAAGSGVNVVTDYGADPTGVVDATSAIAAAVAAACNNASPVFQAKQVFIPGGLYTVSATIPVTNGCWIYGAGQSGIAVNAGGTVLRAAAGFTSGDLFRMRGFGTFRLSNLRMDVTAYFNGGASYARVQAGGAAYAANDTITLTGGTFTTATVLKVTAVSGGAVTGVVITTPGTYSVAPSAVAPVAQGSTSGGGSGATFNVIYANGAAVSISGPTTTLTVDAASGATSLTVASITGFSNGDVIAIEQDDGTYKTTTISGAPSGTTITLAAGLTFKASANHPVYDAYASLPIIDDVSCRGYWDCVRIENAGKVTIRNLFAQDFGHDAIFKFAGPQPDNGADRYQVHAWDLNRTTSNAGVELSGGGDIGIGEKSKIIGSNYSVLLNSYFGPTGTLLIEGNSLEEPVGCAVRLHQSVSGKEYGNVAVAGNEFSNIAGGTSAQTLCIDAGTPTTAAKWIRNVNFTNNQLNASVAAAKTMVSIADGDNITVEGNNLNNNGTAGATALTIGGAATNAISAMNVIAGFPTASYGTMLDSSFAQSVVHGGIKLPFSAASLFSALVIDNTDAGGNGSQIRFDNNGTQNHQVQSVFASGDWRFRVRFGNADQFTMDGSTNLATFVGGVKGATLGMRDTSAAFDVTLGATSSTNLSAGRTLTLDMKNVAHTLAFNATANTITFPNTASYTLIGSADTGTVTNTMLAGSIAASKLTGTDIATVGTLTAGTAGSGFTVGDAIHQQFLVSTSTLTKTSDTALATITGLSQTLTAGKTYHCRGHLTGTANASGGVKVALVATSSLSATSASFTGFTWNGTTGVSNTTVTALGSSIAAATAVYTDMYIDGAIVVNAGGVINVQGAQNASFGTGTTFLLNSTFSCVRVN